MREFEPKFLTDAVAQVGRRPEALIPLLQRLQDKYGYLPEPALEQICATTDIRAADITGVSSFYDMFRACADRETSRARLHRHRVSRRRVGPRGRSAAAALKIPDGGGPPIRAASSRSSPSPASGVARSRRS